MCWIAINACADVPELNWLGRYKLVKMMWKNKSTITRSALFIYNSPETAYQTFTTQQKNIWKKPLQKICRGGSDTVRRADKLA